MKLNMKRHAVVQPLDPSFRLIPLTLGQNALVSTHRYEFLNQFNWCAEPDRKGRTYYAFRKVFIDGKWKRISMHRFILNDYTFPHIDHQNGNGLDNCDGNIRGCTISQNGANCPKRSHNQSGFKGVVKLPSGKFIAQIIVLGAKSRSRTVDTAEEAARAYDRMAVLKFGEFAHLNFPHPEPLDASLYAEMA
jgi:hypothetical protein